MRRLTFIFILCTLVIATSYAAADDYAKSSIMSTGLWYKIQVDHTGIYQLSDKELQSMGFNDPSQVSIVGYGGAPLSEDFSQRYIDDLPLTAQKYKDGRILFFAQGPIEWQYKVFERKFRHTNNPYSNYGYYFVTDAIGPTTMQETKEITGASMRINTFNDYWLHEIDKVSPNKSGREFFGESFISKQNQDFKFDRPGLTNERATVTLRFISKTLTSAGTVSLSINGSMLINGTISKSDNLGDNSYQVALPLLKSGYWEGDKPENNIFTLSYGQTGHTNVYLDYIMVNDTRQLKIYDKATFFRSIESISNASQFTIADANENTEIWDITAHQTPISLPTKLVGSNLSFSIPAGDLREFVAIQTDQTFESPTKVGTIANQNLHALPQVDMIIVAPPAFESEAQRLAEAHTTLDDLSVKVVTPQQIYNEFSSGTPDATAIRRFMKMFYDRKTSSSDAPKYLLLFGDGTYDPRQVSTVWKNIDLSNFVITYQSQESLGVYSFVSDDYFGFLDDDEGSDLAKAQLDLGIGRLPVRTTEEATNAVNKILTYRNNKQLGKWKNELCFIADDGSTIDNYNTMHADQANQIADYVNENYPEFINEKLFFDAYKKDKSTGNGTYPDIETAIQKKLEEGSLLINYTGHGNTEYLSDEQVIKQSDIKQATYTRLPLWVTASCDFTRFDDTNTTAGEDVFLNKTSGGIALYTTSRVVYSEPNFRINKQLIENLFSKNNGIRLTLGDVMKITKQKLGDDANKLNFVLIGDPALKLAYPEYKIKLKTINGEMLSDSPVHFKALEKITITGTILNPNGEIASDFEGELSTTIFDSKKTVQTLNNNGTSGIYSYEDYPNVLYIGNAKVTQGSFSFTFTVPKDISYSDASGKISLYASDATHKNEAQGAYLNFIVGGSENITEDSDSPEIVKLYLDDTNFIDGNEVSESPFFFVQLADNYGINISGGSIGHDIILTLDNNPTQSYNLNNYYQTLPESAGQGTIKFTIPTLDLGTHTAELKVWNVLNNSTTKEFTFVVSKRKKKNELTLTATSPAKEKARFALQHNTTWTKAMIRIDVFDMTGQLQWQQTEEASSEAGETYEIEWNLQNNRGGRIREGIYIYRAIVQENGKNETKKSNKMIILGQ